MAADGKILVIRGGAIGDFVLTLPVYAALRSRFPGIRIETVAYPAVGELARLGGFVDAVRPIESGPLAGFFADRNPSLDSGWSGYFAGFTVIFSFLYDPDGIFAANVKSCTGARFIQGPHRPDESEPVHATAVLMRPLEQLAVFDADPVPRLALSGISSNDPVDASWIAIHPGSGSETKNWPLENWIDLAGRIEGESDSKFLIVGGEAEGERLERLAASVDPARVRVMRNLPLGELAAVLRDAGVFLGHDSGITHLAAALGLRGLALWGPSNHTVWQPMGGRMQTLQAAGLAGLSVETVWGRVAPLIRDAGAT